MEVDFYDVFQIKEVWEHKKIKNFKIW